MGTARKKPRTRSRYGVDITKKGKEKRTFQGVVFDSEMELKALRDYFLPLKEQGEIKEIERQKEFILQPAYTKNGKRILPIKYVADYVVTWKDGTVEVIEIKGGMVDPIAVMKRKMFDYIYPDLTLRWMSVSVIDGGLVDFEIVKRGRKERKKAKSKE